MELFISKEFGPCYGVRDAVDIAIETSVKADDATPVYSFGNIIHNHHTINLLQNTYGIKTVTDPDAVEKGSKVIIRTHGARKDEIEKLREKGADVIDATCPFVLKTQKWVKSAYEDGYFIVIFGHRNHPEVIGIRGQIPEHASMVIDKPEDIKALRWKLKIAAVFQSTVTYDDFKWAVAEVASRCYDFRLIQTICTVTTTRQKFASELAREVDAMIIIGGKNSSNTKKLAEVCSQYTKTIHIEEISEIDDWDLAPCKKVGISTGTSTPNEQLMELVNKLEKRYGAYLCTPITV